MRSRAHTFITNAKKSPSLMEVRSHELFCQLPVFEYIENKVWTKEEDRRVFFAPLPKGILVFSMRQSIDPETVYWDEVKYGGPMMSSCVNRAKGFLKGIFERNGRIDLGRFISAYEIDKMMKTIKQPSIFARFIGPVTLQLCDFFSEPFWRQFFDSAPEIKFWDHEVYPVYLLSNHQVNASVSLKDVRKIRF